jgi:WD40 repeat protein
VASPATFGCQTTLKVHSNGVQSISYSPAGDLIAAGCNNGKIHILDTVTVAVKRSLSGHNDPVLSVCFSPCGTKIVSGGGRNKYNRGNEDFSIRIWDAETGTQIGSPLSGHKDPVRSVCFSPCGTKIVSGGGQEKGRGGNVDFSIRIWDAETGTQIGSPLKGHSDIVRGVCLSPDGSKLASCSDDESVKIWNLITRECVSTVDPDVSGVAFSPDGSKIAAGHYKKIQIFDAQTQAQLGSPLSGHRYRQTL